MRKIISNFEEFKNIESGSLQEELLRLRKLRGWCDSATQSNLYKNDSEIVYAKEII